MLLHGRNKTTHFSEHILERQGETYLAVGKPRPNIPVAPNCTIRLLVSSIRANGCCGIEIQPMVAVSKPAVPWANVPVFESPYSISRSVLAVLKVDTGYRATSTSLQALVLQLSDTSHKSLEPVSVERKDRFCQHKNHGN